MDSWFPTFRRVLNRPIWLPSWLSSWWPSYTTSVQRQSLLRLIVAALEQNVPLAPLLEQWAKDEHGAQGRRIQRLAALLKSGRPLADAVEEIPGLLRDEDVLAIRFDAQSGTRTAAARHMLDDALPAAASPLHRARRTFGYLLVVVPIGLILIAFLQFRIVPILQRMFQEFGLRLPELLVWSRPLMMTLLGYWWLALIAFCVLLWCMFSTRGGRLIRNSIVGRWIGPTGQRQSADVLEKLSVGLSAGRPVASALSTLARYHFTPAIRHQLLFVRNEMEQGADIWQSMTAVGLLTPAETRLMSTAERLGNRGWALAQLAAVKKRRTEHRMQRAAELLLPVVIVALGAIVLLQALTVFQPLIQMLKGLV
jgi:type II secretory pathway component PulF